MHEPDMFHTFENDIFSEVGWGGPADSATYTVVNADSVVTDSAF